MSGVFILRADKGINSCWDKRDCYLAIVENLMAVNKQNFGFVLSVDIPF